MTIQDFTELVIAEELTNITTEVLSEKIENEFNKTHTLLKNTIDETFNDNSNSFELNINEIINIKKQETINNLSNEISSTFSADIDDYVNTKSYINAISTKAICMQTGEQIIDEKIETVIAPAISDIDDKIKNIETSYLQIKDEIQTKELSSVTNLNANLNSLQNSILEAKNTIDDKITMLNNSISETVDNTLYTDATYIMNVNFNNVNNALNNLITTLNDSDSTINLSQTIIDVKNDILNNIKFLFETNNDRLLALRNVLQTSKRELDGSLEAIESRLEDFIVDVSQEIRLTLTKEKLYVKDNLEISGEDIIDGTIDYIKNKKIERTVAINFNDIISNIQFRLDNSKLVLVFENVDTYSNDGISKIKYKTVDNYNHKTLVKTSFEMGDINRTIIESDVSDNINITKILYILRSGKTSSYKDDDVENSYKDNSCCKIGVEYNDSEGNYKDLNFEIFNIDSISTDETHKTITVIFNSLKIDIDDTIKIKNNNMSIENFIKNRTTTTTNKQLTSLTLLFNIYQDKEDDIFSNILKSDLTVTFYELISKLENDANFNSFIDVNFSANIGLFIISNNLFETLKNTSFDYSLTEVFGITELERSDSGTIENYNLFRQILLSLLICYKKSITINFDINRQSVDTNNIEFIKGGKLVLKKSDYSDTAFFTRGSILKITYINEDKPNVTNDLLGYTSKEYYIIDINSNSEIYLELILSEERNSQILASTQTITVTDNPVNKFKIETWKNPIVYVEDNDIITLLAFRVGIVKDTTKLIKYLIEEFNEQNNTTKNIDDLKY